MKNKNKKVCVGLSGGVDSSVTAFLLKESGYDVVGVFIKIWHPDFLFCNWREEMRDAMRVCAELHIPFKMIDFSREYQEKVIEYMIKEYSLGRTPNPDVLCNSEIKFGLFSKYAFEMGFDYLATGHYARIIDGKLYKGIDSAKDQSYFLWKINSKELDRYLMPIGDYKKEEIRKIAKKVGLSTASKKDSQGLCFLGKVEMDDYLKKHIKTESGDILDLNRNKIGKHQGSVLFTIGEKYEKDMYVLSKDLSKNTITVGKKEDLLVAGRKILVTDTIWFENMQDKKYQFNLRYHAPLHECSVKIISAESAEIIFEDATEVSAPGQSIVIYDGEKVCGGGIISKQYD